jgi:hypothetical protein
MRLYELDIGSLWWVAAEDDFAATDILRDELVQREIGDEEMDEAMDDLIIRELEEEDANLINVVDEFGSSMTTLWDLFLGAREPELLTSDFHLEDLEDEEE